MKENQVYVESCADCTIVIDLPEFHLKREWIKRGAKYPFERDMLEQAFYNRAVESLFRKGYLKCNDKEFMLNVGLLKEDDTPVVIELTETLMKRMIGVMPMNEFKETLKKLQANQILDLAEYAIEHNQDLKMDKADLLTKLTGKNILRAIEFAKADQEG